MPLASEISSSDWQVKLVSHGVILSPTDPLSGEALVDEGARMFRNLWIAFICMSVVCDCPLIVAQSDTAQTPHTAAASSAIKKLISAKKAFLIAGAPDEEQRKTPGLFHQNLASTPLAYEELTNALQKWGRFEIVNDAAQADVVLVLLEWSEQPRKGILQCHNNLMAFQGGVLPPDLSNSIWRIDGGKWGGCSAAKGTVKQFRVELEKAEKAGG